MKRYIKSFVTAGLFSLTLVYTGCIEETEPTTVATLDQIQRSSQATKAQALAIPAALQAINESYIDNNNWHAVFGYPAMMIIRDLMTSDMGFPTSSYSGHFYRYGSCQLMGGDYTYASYIWNFYYSLIQTANAVIDVVDPASATSDQLGYLGAAYAYRAMCYLDLARMYEWLPNDKTTKINADGNNIQGLTVPIVKEGLSEEEARNNPRAARATMVAFIKDDLAKAEEYIPNISDRLNRTMPNLACVYGLEARFNMWAAYNEEGEENANANEYFTAAAVAAQKAISAAGMTPLSEDVATDVASGMNTNTEFLWCANLVKEDDAVQTGIVNFTSWISNQTQYGYTGAATGQYMICDRLFYERISNTDWRKKWWQAPEDSPLREQIKYLSADDAEGLPPYASIKFRPGQGNVDDYNVGSAVAIPLMRVEEFYFIKAEAEAHIDPNTGINTLAQFMRDYRDPVYVSKAASSVESAVDEIIFQKRVEFWGEGICYFDYKRLNMSVHRGYEGTPFFDQLQLNTDGRPAWMNIVISVGEYQNNKAVTYYNNPDPSDLYTPWTKD